MRDGWLRRSRRASASTSAPSPLACLATKTSEPAKAAFELPAPPVRRATRTSKHEASDAISRRIGIQSLLVSRLLASHMKGADACAEREPDRTDGVASKAYAT